MKYINEEKVQKIKFTKENMYVAIDFDKTITIRNGEDSWAVAGKLLGDEANYKINKLYEKYRPIELDYNITFEEKNKAMEEWYQLCLQVYYEYNLSKKTLEESVKTSNLTFRKGAKEFLTKMNEKNIPVIILSAGIGNVIEQFLKDTKCYYNNIFIISNFIPFDESGNAKEYTNKIIHTLNKTMNGHISKKLEKELQNRQYKLLLGDMIEDKYMVEQEEWKNTITVGFLNENIEENKDIYQKEFDIVLTDDDASFETVEKIVFK